MSSGGRPRGKRTEPSRKQLMAAAIDCFALLGYQGTSIDRIARDAGVTKGAVYYHFRDKEDFALQAGAGMAFDEFLQCRFAVSGNGRKQLVGDREDLAFLGAGL